MTKTEIDKVIEALDEQFMQPEIWQGDAWEVSANHGETHIVPTDVVGVPYNYPGIIHSADVFQPYVDGTVDTYENGAPVAEVRRNVWFARLSAPGYMDSTEYSVFETEEEAREYLAETYGDDIELNKDEDEDEDGAICPECERSHGPHYRGRCSH